MRLKVSLSSKKVASLFKKYIDKIIYLIFIISFLYLLFFLYQYLYLPISEKRPIDPSLIQSKKEVVNQQLFEKVSKAMEEKTTSAPSSVLNIDDPF